MKIVILAMISAGLLGLGIDTGCYAFGLSGVIGILCCIILTTFKEMNRR